MVSDLESECTIESSKDSSARIKICQQKHGHAGNHITILLKHTKKDDDGNVCLQRYYAFVALYVKSIAERFLSILLYLFKKKWSCIEKARPRA